MKYSMSSLPILAWTIALCSSTLACGLEFEKKNPNGGESTAKVKMETPSSWILKVGESMNLKATSAGSIEWCALGAGEVTHAGTLTAKEAGPIWVLARATTSSVFQILFAASPSESKISPFLESHRLSPADGMELGKHDFLATMEAWQNLWSTVRHGTATDSIAPNFDFTNNAILAIFTSMETFERRPVAVEIGGQRIGIIKPGMIGSGDPRPTGYMRAVYLYSLPRSLLYASVTQFRVEGHEQCTFPSEGR